MLKLNLKPGTPLFIGAPATPMPQTKSDAITELVASIEGIDEAHVPQVFIEGTISAQVLVVVVNPHSNRSAVAELIGLGLDRILPHGETLDFVPLSADSPLMRNVREADCMINAKPSRSWWKIW